MLIIASDPIGAGIDAKVFLRAGFDVNTTYCGRAALAIEPLFRPAIILLDTELPDMSGFELCAALSRTSSTDAHIVLVTAQATERDLVHGFTLGADDYLIKPFSGPELLARVQSFVRRRGRDRISNRVDTRAATINFVLDPQTQTLHGDIAEIHLHRTEYRLLDLFLGSPGKLILRPHLLERMWNNSSEVSARLVDIYVAKVRKKLVAAGANVTFTSVRSMGYRLDFTALSPKPPNIS